MTGMDPTKAGFWRKHIDRAAERGVALSRYCVDQGLPKGQAAYWARRLAKSSPASTAFVRVTRTSDGPPAILRVSFPDGVTIEATASVAASVIADVVVRLRGGA